MSEKLPMMPRHSAASRRTEPTGSVHVAGAREGKPGGGYFRVNGYRDPFGERATAEQMLAAYAFWEEQVHQCRRWGDGHRRERA